MSDDVIRKSADGYIKGVNEVYAMYQLSTCRQIVRGLLEEFLQRLNVLSTDCNFRDFTAAQHQETELRDVFTAGMQYSYIRQRVF